MVTNGEHYRSTGGTIPAGIYRVVGTAGAVVLLRVATPGGRRVNTGEIHHVAPERFEESFTPADNPDAGFDPARALRNAASGIFWQFRRFW